jgi:hypothetical protein
MPHPPSPENDDPKNMVHISLQELDPMKHDHAFSQTRLQCASLDTMFFARRGLGKSSIFDIVLFVGIGIEVCQGHKFALGVFAFTFPLATILLGLSIARNIHLPRLPQRLCFFFESLALNVVLCNGNFDLPDELVDFGFGSEQVLEGALIPVTIV